MAGWNCTRIKSSGESCYGQLTDDGNGCEPCDSQMGGSPNGGTSKGLTGEGLLNNTNLRDQYSVLGGVVAPKRSAFTIQGMQNPLAQAPTKKIDRSLPSLRDNSAVSRFNDFNPYNNSPARSPEVVRNNMSFNRKNSSVIYKTNVNTFQPMGSPVLTRKFTS
tara:strand:- start:3070 stop:3555 length:486 start_codon:yes stop_codon:yes gene_type:complete